jgi:hypothetical protein
MVAWLKGKVGAGSIGPGWGNGKTTAVVFARRLSPLALRRLELMSPSSTAADVRFWHEADVERRCCDAPFVTEGSWPWRWRWWPWWSRRRWLRLRGFSRLKC